MGADGRQRLEVKVDGRQEVEIYGRQVEVEVYRGQELDGVPGAGSLAGAVAGSQTERNRGQELNGKQRRMGDEHAIGGSLQSRVYSTSSVLQVAFMHTRMSFVFV